jgi:hypothetical protein
MDLDMYEFKSAGINTVIFFVESLHFSQGRQLYYGIFASQGCRFSKVKKSRQIMGSQFRSDCTYARTTAAKVHNGHNMFQRREEHIQTQWWIIKALKCINGTYYFFDRNCWAISLRITAECIIYYTVYENSISCTNTKLREFRSPALLFTHSYRATYLGSASTCKSYHCNL